MITLIYIQIYKILFVLVNELTMSCDKSYVPLEDLRHISKSRKFDPEDERITTTLPAVLEHMLYRLDHLFSQFSRDGRTCVQSVPRSFEEIHGRSALWFIF